MILSVRNLEVDFRNHKDKQQIIKGISFEVKEDTCVGILGESGSGKSMTWKSIMNLLNKNFDIRGEVNLLGNSLLNLSDKERRKTCGKHIGVVVQNPMTAFNPLFTIKSQMIDTFRAHSTMSKREAKKLAMDTLTSLKLENVALVLEKYPHELSGGMLQRIMIGTAIALKPALIIADEPTTAIDVINQVEVLNELREVREKYKTSMIFISHDLGAISRIADEVIVMEDGIIVEKGTTEEIMTSPKSEAARFLVNSRNIMMSKFETGGVARAT